MGPLPFDVDEWMRKGLETDLPLPEPGDDGGKEEWEYNFNVRSRYYGGTYFQLRYSPQRGAHLDVGGGGSYPADLEGWRSVVAYLNQNFGGSVFDVRYIWLHGSDALMREADDRHQYPVATIMAASTRELPTPDSTTSSPLPSRDRMARRLAWRRRRWWPWGRG
ncbi:hypothetical protein CLM62_25815 [Streptomyces sp. SA15]|nr:hypothetical protein CLM62_25815 [Streptomyces sp. SA15]